MIRDDYYLIERVPIYSSTYYILAHILPNHQRIFISMGEYFIMHGIKYIEHETASEQLYLSISEL